MRRIVIEELKEFSDLITKKHNIFEGISVCIDNFTQAQAVCFIGDNKDREVSQKDIEKALNLSKSSVSSLIDTLEKKGVIQREASFLDARRNVIRLSQNTLDSISIIENNILDLNNNMINNISEDKLNTFFEVLDLMKDNIRKD